MVLPHARVQFLMDRVRANATLLLRCHPACMLEQKEKFLMDQGQGRRRTATTDAAKKDEAVAKRFFAALVLHDLIQVRSGRGSREEGDDVCWLHDRRSLQCGPFLRLYAQRTLAVLIKMEGAGWSRALSSV